MTREEIAAEVLDRLLDRPPKECLNWYDRGEQSVCYTHRGRNKNNYFCTRRPGHSGAHVATGDNSRILARWRNDNDGTDE